VGVPLMVDSFPVDLATRPRGFTRPRRTQSLFRHFSQRHISVFTAVSDLVLIFAASVVAGVFYHLFFLASDTDLHAYAAVGGYSSFIFVLLFNSLGLYRPNALLSAATQIRGIFIAWGVVLLFLTSVFFLLKIGANHSRGATISFGFVGLVLILASHARIGFDLRRAIASGTLAGPRVIVIGEPEELAANSALHLLRAYGTQEVGRFEVSSSTDRSRSHTARDIAIIDSAINAAKNDQAEQVLLALCWVDTRQQDFIERLRALPLPVFLLPDRFVNSILSRASWRASAQTPVEIQRAPLSRRELMVKRVIDLTLAGLALVMLSPLLLITSLAIKLESPGPVIFRQRRRGFNGRVFAIYKFRTMRVLEDGPTIRQAQPNDDRVTSLGHLLRSSSIDELPQLFNVLAGEMSLVGPRPHALAHDDEYSKSIDRYAFRYHVRPGITGWAQIHGFRGPTSDVGLMKKRVQLDLWYINNWSLRLDVRIMLRTCLEVLRPRNAW